MRLTDTFFVSKVFSKPNTFWCFSFIFNSEQGLQSSNTNMAYGSLFSQSFPTLEENFSINNLISYLKDPLNQNNKHLEKSQRSIASNVAIDANLSSDSIYNNYFTSPKSVVMIDHGYLHRNSHRFPSSLNLKSFKSNDTDNSLSKEKNIFRRYSTSDIMHSLTMKHNQNGHDSNKFFNVNKQGLPHNEKKRKAVSLDEMHSALQNPATRARLVSYSNSFNLETKAPFDDSKQKYHFAHNRFCWHKKTLLIFPWIIKIACIKRVVVQFLRRTAHLNGAKQIFRPSRCFQMQILLPWNRAFIDCDLNSIINNSF